MNNRIVKPCRCRKPGENPFGYGLFRWMGHSWKNVINTDNVFDSAKYSDRKNLKTVLIVCRNCGSEILREYPQTPKHL